MGVMHVTLGPIVIFFVGKSPADTLLLRELIATQSSPARKKLHRVRVGMREQGEARRNRFARTHEERSLAAQWSGD